jgi:hypothetical protein
MDTERRMGAFTRGRGKAGAMMQVEVKDGFAQVYEIPTHGMTKQEVDAAVEEIVSYHAKKVARLANFPAIVGSEFTQSGQSYRVTDCTVREAGNMVELYLCVRRVLGPKPDGPFGPRNDERLLGMPMKLKYGSIDDVPNDSQIVNLLREWVREYAADVASHAELKRQLGV